MKSSKFKLASIILAVVLCLLVLSAPAGAVVQPNSDFYVLDNENVLSAETEKYIIDRNLNLVSNCKGAQVCVVVTDSTNGQDIEEYATELFNAWGIGSKTEDNGVLILFLTDDDNYWIMPGIGLERVLTERVLRQIIDDDCEPSFARKDYDSAAKATFIAINQVVCNYYSQDPNGSGDSDNFPNNNGNNYYPDDHPDYNSGSSCLSCGSCLALSCAACGSCGSCSGGSFMGIIIVIIIVFVFFKIIASIGRGGRRFRRRLRSPSSSRRWLRRWLRRRWPRRFRRRRTQRRLRRRSRRRFRRRRRRFARRRCRKAISCFQTSAV
mgnify:CR=1 FL=1